MYWSGLSVCALAPLFNTCYILQGFIKLSWCAISQLCLIQNLACDSLQRKMWNVFKALEMYSFNNSQSYMMYYKKTICKILHSRKDNFALFLLLLRTCFIIFFFYTFLHTLDCDYVATFLDSILKKESSHVNQLCWNKGKIWGTLVIEGQKWTQLFYSAKSQYKRKGWMNGNFANCAVSSQ